MDYCKINDVNYDVIVTDIQEDFTILYGENTGRTLGEGVPMELEPLGTFFSHKVTFKRSRDNVEEFDRLFDFLTTPRYTGFPVEIVHNQTTIKYEAYVSQGSRKIIRILQKLQKVFWGGLTVNFVPIKAQIIPKEQEGVE